MYYCQTVMLCDLKFPATQVAPSSLPFSGEPTAKIQVIYLKQRTQHTCLFSPMLAELAYQERETGLLLCSWLERSCRCKGMNEQSLITRNKARGTGKRRSDLLKKNRLVTTKTWRCNNSKNSSWSIVILKIIARSYNTLFGKRFRWNYHWETVPTAEQRKRNYPAH